MRIAIVTPVYPNSEEPYRGIFNYRRAKALAQFADVEVFCTLSTYPSWLKGRLRAAQRKYHEVDAAFTTPGVTVHYVSYPAIPVLTRPLNGYLCARAVLPHLSAFRPDVILGYWVFPEGYGAVIAGAKLGVPVIVQTLGSDLRRIPDPLSRILTTRTLQQADYVLAVSDEQRRVAIEVGADPARTQTVRNGCDAAAPGASDRAAARAELGIAADTELVLFIGRLVELKGIGELLAASRMLAQKHGKLKVVCIGEGVLDQKFQSIAGPQVNFIGRQPPAQVTKWLAACNVLCLPSHSEGMPNVVLEALVAGRPVVASNVGGIPEVVDEACGILTPPHDATKLAAALDAALTRTWDEALIAKRFSRTWEDFGRETFDVCERVIRVH